MLSACRAGRACSCDIGSVAHVAVRVVWAIHGSNHMCEHAKFSHCCDLLMVGVKEAQMTELRNPTIHKSAECNSCTT